MSPNTVYLISGANRGIGLGLVSTLLQSSPTNIIFAGTRNPSQSPALTSLAQKYPERLFVVELTSGGVDDNEIAVKEIEMKVGRLDVVIANAGISNNYDKVGDVSLDQMREHYEVNTIGPLVLFQAVQRLLLKSEKGKWVLISTAAASLGQPFPLQIAAYGASKASANYLITRMALEYPSLISLAISPGWVQTDMGNQGAKANGMELAPVTIEDSVKGILKVVEGARKEEAGRFFDQEGKELIY